MARLDLSNGVIRSSAAFTQPDSPLNYDIGMGGAGGIRVRMNISAAGGTTPTLDVKFQYYDAARATYEDLTDSAKGVVAFAQKTGTGEDDLVIYPGITQDLTTTNRKYSLPVPRLLRIVCTTGADADETFTVSLAAERLK
jgi:hypothetical protein